MRIASIAVAIVGVFMFVGVVSAEMSSSNFEVRFDSVGSSGLDTSSSASFQLRDSTDANGPGDSTAATFQLSSGYRAGIFDTVINFSVAAQSNATEQAATASVGTTITTSTAGLAVEDFVVLVQNKGAGQVSAVGKIISIGAGTITVDELKDGGVAPVIDGTNDFLYILTGSSVDLGTLDALTVSTSVVGMDVNAEVDNGYTIQVFDDGNLRNGANDINDVADGTVTAGSEEYGGRSSDVSLASTFDTDDTAFTTGFQEVASRSVTSFESRDFVTLKASISGGTTGAAYAHTLSFIVSANY